MKWEWKGIFASEIFKELPAVKKDMLFWGGVTVATVAAIGALCYYLFTKE